MRRLLFVLVALTQSCTPPPKPAPDPTAARAANTNEPSSSGPRPPGTSETTVASSSSKPTNRLAHACGLPAALRARGWDEHLTPVASERPDVPEPSRLTIAVLPDTQYYSSCRYPHLANQTAWLTQNANSLNLKAAIHLGDITDNNVAEEWLFARRALDPLLSLVPTFMATGNHDHGHLGTANQRGTQFLQFFAPLPAPTQATLASTAVPGDHENAYYRVALPKVTLGVLVLGWSPQESTVAWANKVLTHFPNDRVIFVTHAYLYTDSTRYDWVGRGPAQEWNPNSYGATAADAPSGMPLRPGQSSPESLANEASAQQPSPARDVYDGERLWQSLVSRHKGIFLTLNGHVLHHGTGLLTSKGKNGNDVHQVLVNYQMLHEGGSGYLRLLELSPDGRSLHFRTYSPSLHKWAVSPEQHFDLTVTPALW